MSDPDGLPVLRLEILPAGFERVLASAAEEDDEALTEEERWFAERVRCANTGRAYRADLADFAGWCEQASRSAPQPVTVVGSYGLFERPRRGADT